MTIKNCFSKLNSQSNVYSTSLHCKINQAKRLFYSTPCHKDMRSAWDMSIKTRLSCTGLLQNLHQPLTAPKTFDSVQQPIKTIQTLEILPCGKFSGAFHVETHKKDSPVTPGQYETGIPIWPQDPNRQIQEKDPVIKSLRRFWLTSYLRQRDTGIDLNNPLFKLSFPCTEFS